LVGATTRTGLLTTPLRDRFGLTFRLESGTSFAAFARKMCRAGLAGLSWAVGIPGTLGGAGVSNAGACGGCLADVLRRVRMVDSAGRDEWIEAPDLGLVYRGSVFTRGQFAGKAVLETEVELAPGDANTRPAASHCTRPTA